MKNNVFMDTEESKKDRPLYILGDVHGKFRNLIQYIHEKSIENCYLICVGDLGIGFNYSFKGEIEACKTFNKFLKERNINFLSIRGNHDDPTFFKGASRLNFTNFELLEDYTVRELNGEKFLFVGGAVSIDRLFRKQDISYWIDEIFVLDESKIVECDVLITHSVPSWSGDWSKSGISSWCERDPTLWDECVKERQDHDRLIELCKAKWHYSGHMHISTVTYNNCTSKILNELEFTQHYQPST
jgi:UDP-2,3-diacylglucosamine pyrophosphatase LpxH